MVSIDERDRWAAEGDARKYVFRGRGARGAYVPPSTDGIMPELPDASRGAIEFTANHTIWPFNENIQQGHPDSDYRDRIPPELTRRLRQWGASFLDSRDGAGEFSSQETRAEFDRQYIELARELAELGFHFRLSLWW